MEEIPIWKTPRKAMPPHPARPGQPDQRNGMDTAKVTAWLSRMDSRDEPSFCARNATIAPAKATPLAMATTLPSMLPTETLSMKKRVMPPTTTAMVTQSRAEAFSFRNIHPNIAA